jgi:hypothetical protein
MKRFLLHPNGTVQTRRAVPLGILFAVLGFFGSFLVFATTHVSGNDTIRTLWVIGAVFLLKAPLLTLLWWLIIRNREWPGRPVKWGADETREILAFLDSQAQQAITRPDAAPRLAHLSREAWNAADNLDGEARVDALTVALRIDEMASRVRAGRETDS